MIEYEDFSLKIEPRRGDVYPIIVLRSPAGEGRSSFQLPFDPDEIGDILFDLGRTVRGSSQSPLRDVSPAATRTPPQKVGDQLFNALFSGTVRSLLDRSLGMIHGRQRGLRIKLHIDPEDSDLARLASLLWEFLYRKETRDWLNLSQYTPIVRYLDVQRAYTPLPLELPLRILVVISKPSGYVQLDLERERALIEKSWAKQKNVQVEFMEEATILALQDRLSEQRYHVLHYMGHGDLDERTGRGVLLMEDDRGKGDKVDGRTLGILLRDVRTLRLVFLNACETAKVAKEKGLDPFAGVASAMVMAGIPAVVAMQFPISDGAAITFARRFYPLLARGYPADAAVAEGRRAIRLAEPETMEWGTPVLFMRAPQGVIFQVSGARPAKAPVHIMPELPSQADQELEQRLEQLYTDGLGAFWLEEWERACRSFQAIVNVRPDYRDAAAKLQDAERQRKLHALYDQARTAREAQDWQGALSALEELVAEAAEFEGAATLLQAVKKKKQLADLYAEARQLHRARQWQAVINVFGQITAVEPDYPDPEGLLPTAEQEIAEQKRQAKLKGLYSSALGELNAQHLSEARQLLIQIRQIEPDYGETERLLAKVDAEIAKEEEQHRRKEAERQQQEQIATLYKQALELAQVEKWRQVLSKMEGIRALDPQFADPEGIAAKAKRALQNAEAQRLAAEKVEAKRIATDKAEAERLEVKDAEAEQVTDEKVTAKQLAEKRAKANERTASAVVSAPARLQSGILTKLMWPAILLTSIGWSIWGIILLLPGSTSDSQVLIAFAITGGIGGLITGLALRWTRLFTQWKQIFVVAIGWAVAWAIGLPLLTSTFGTGIGIDVGFIIVGAIVGIAGGLITGLALRQAELSIQWKQIFIVATGWAIGWAIGCGLGVSIDLDLPAAVVGAIPGAIAGMIGGGVMFSQLKWASHNA